MGMGFAPTCLRQVSRPPASHDQFFNHCPYPLEDRGNIANYASFPVFRGKTENSGAHLVNATDLVCAAAGRHVMAGWRVADPCHLMPLGRDVPAPVHLPRVPPGSFAPQDDEAGQRVCAVMDETVLSTYSRHHTALNIHCVVLAVGALSAQRDENTARWLL